jgi:hypothetical protein
MLKVLDDLTCQLFHGEFAEVVSYSRQGAWHCGKPGCASQATHDRDVLRARRRHAPLALPTVHPQSVVPTRRAA